MNYFQKNVILFIVSFVMFMEAVDTTIINTAIPVMAQSLQANPIDLKLALISYLLSLAIFIPISGWIADKYGTNKIFILAIAIFTASSIWCGFTHNLTELVIARIAQGLGGSLTVPLGRLIIIRTYEKHEFISKMNIIIMIGSLGLMIGPTLGGIITQHFSWRWVFWVNAPVGIASIIMTYYYLPTMAARHVHKLDKLGFILFGFALAGLTFGLSSFSESNIKPSTAITIIFTSILLFIYYAWHSRHKLHPIVKIQLLFLRTFRISILGNLITRLGFGGTPFLLSLLLQISLGYSAQTAGLLLAPIALGILFVKPFSLYLLRFLGYKNLLLINTVLVCVALCSFSFIHTDTSLLNIALLTFLYGFLMTLQYTGMNSLAYANITQEDFSAATSIMSTVQQLSQSFGVAVAAILVRYFADDFTNKLTLTTQTFHQAFLSMGAITLFSSVVFIFLKKEDGHELIENKLNH